MSKVLSGISILATLVCAGVLLAIGSKCLSKFNEKLKGANVGIVQASTQPYPAITICPLRVYYENEKYIESLSKCNLTTEEYSDNGTWWSETCTDPVKLYNDIVGTHQDLVKEIEFELENKTKIEDVDFTKVDNPSYPDPEPLGRCFAVSILEQGLRIAKIRIVSNDEVEVKIHAPGNLFDEDNIYWHLPPDSDDDIDITKEIFEVLDFDGEPCKTYGPGQSRDQCVTEIMINKTLEKYNCTTPFLQGPDSSICSDQANARNVLAFYEELKGNATAGKIEQCPMPCKYQMINFGRFSQSKVNGTDGSLVIKFRKFLKYSKVSYTYQGLELFAEFGGYLGLLLGMSLNQIPELLNTVTQKIGKLF